MEGYSEYKDSGINYLPPLPAHWKRTQLKRVLATPITDGPHETPELLDDGIPFLSAESVKNLTLDFELKRGYISEEDHKRFCQKCNPQYGDIFMVKSGATTGNIAMVTTHEKFSVWSPLALIRSDENKIHNEFLFQLLQSSDFRMQVELFWSYGTQQNIGMVVLGNQYVILPPIEEQKGIARRLTAKLNRIDGLLADLTRQAEMLETYKRELIASAVTKGLDKAVPMKDSGVEWIGEIPAHWDITPLRAFLKVVSVKNNVDLPLLSVEREKGVVDRETEGSENNHNRIPDDLSNYKVVRAGQFVMNKMKAWRGSYGVSSYDGIVSPAYYVFALNFPTPTFFNYAIRSTKYIGFFGRDSYGIRTDQWDFKIGAIKDIPFAVPPVEEQQSIIEYLNSKIPLIEGLVADITEQKEKLKQYRQIVIHDAVTGKIKVTEG